MPGSDLLLQTERLTLRALTLGDLDAMSTLLGDAEALVLWGEALDREGARSWIERNLARYASHGIGRCAVIWRETGELVGDCGLIPTVVEGTDEIELGWITRRSFWGRGIATEAGAAWRDYGLHELGLARIVSMIDERNAASRRIAEKLGFSVEREAMWGGEGPFLMYSIGGATTTPPTPAPPASDALEALQFDPLGEAEPPGPAPPRRADDPER